jgi:hypothetical protein
MSGNQANAGSVAVSVAKQLNSKDGDGHIVILKGIRVRLSPVAATLIDEVTSRIKDPDVPIWHDPDKDRDMPNPLDPQYVKDVSEASRLRGVAAMDAMCMFGAELLDGMPEDDTWLKKLRYMAKRGMVNLDNYDLDDELDQEFLYKRFILVDNETLMAIGKMSTLQTDEVAKAEESFPGN